MPQYEVSSPRGASVSADIFIDTEQHRELRHDIINLARELDVRSMPTNYAVKLGGISLAGNMPLTYRKLLGVGHHRMSFAAEYKSTDAEGDAHMNITLHGPSPDRQVHLQSDNSPVEFGKNKNLHIVPHTLGVAIGNLACDDVCLMLDDYIPNPGRTFTNLVDPDQEKSFAQITHAIGDTLATKAKSSQLRHLYAAGDSRFSMASQQFTEFYTGASLGILQKDKRTTYALTIASPVDLWSARVMESFTYKFDYTPWRGKGYDTRPIDADARISLASLTLSEKLLSDGIGRAQEKNGYNLSQRAMAIVRNDHLA